MMRASGFASRMVLGLIVALALTVAAHANTSAQAWDKAPDKSGDLAALQNGARIFVNYCLNCHSAAYHRYNRLRDIGLSAEQIKSSLMVTDAKIGDTMKAAIDPQQAKGWFGMNPPDLTVIVRSRAGAGGSGADYLYTFMRTFYRDDSRPSGWNNRAFPNVAMPHVLWQLQGEPGSVSAVQYDQTIADLVAYLQWMGEPAQNTRQRVGVWVLLFLGILTYFTWRLNAAYWKDVK